MTAPNMATITASIERSLQNCSLTSDSNNTTATAAPGARSSPDFADNTLELNSQIRLPCYWEQCLDLKTGEVYYINWRTGIRSRYDPRVMMNPEMNINIVGGGPLGRVLSSEEEAEEEDDEQSANDSQGSSTEVEGEEEESRSPSSSTTTSRSEQCHYNIPAIPSYHGECESENESSTNDNQRKRRQQVLVVAGCKGCFMYFMVPKQVEDCPKCFGQLLHFDRSQNGSP